MQIMFRYLGAKWRLAKFYGAPRSPVVVEPFAGSAAYSLYWNVKKAILYDLNEKVCGAWDFLIHATEKDIRSIPVDFESFDELKIPQEAKWFVGFWCDMSKGKPAECWPNWVNEKKGYYQGLGVLWSAKARERVARQVRGVKDWEIHCADYRTAPNIKAQWFVDPPYAYSPNEADPENKFRISNQYGEHAIDYKELAKFCRSRKGHAVVCERLGAEWLPFEQFRQGKVVHRPKQFNQPALPRAKEVVWYSMPVKRGLLIPLWS
jgi:site-specific DNA-adenine methylase